MRHPSTRQCIAITAASFLAFVFIACAQSPVAVAQNPELKAQALYAEYVLAEEAATRLMHSPDVPITVKASIQSAHGVVTPIAEQLDDQRLNVAKLRITDPQSVPGAILALNELILQVTPLLNSFKGAVK